jgi:hypothetical protein
MKGMNEMRRVVVERGRAEARNQATWMTNLSDNGLLGALPLAIRGFEGVIDQGLLDSLTGLVEKGDVVGIRSVLNGYIGKEPEYVGVGRGQRVVNPDLFAPGTPIEGQKEELTAQQQAYEVYAQSLYPNHEGPNARSLLTDADLLAYDKRQAGLGRSPGGGALFWGRTGGMTRDENGNFVPARDPEGNQIQPRDMSTPVSSLAESISPEYKSAIGRSIMYIPGTRRDSMVDEFNRAWERSESTGDRSMLNDLIRYTAVETENVDTKNRIIGRMATVNSLRDVRETLRKYNMKGADGKAAELPTGWLVGNIENLWRKIGMSQDTRYVELANRLLGTLINYRRAATGVQFGQTEARQYERMIPDYRNLPDVNEGLINGLLDEMESYDSTYWIHKLGAEGAELIGMVDRPGVIETVERAFGA